MFKRKSSNNSEEQQTKKQSLSGKQLFLLVVFIIAISLVINFSFNGFYAGRETSPQKVPFWLFFIGAGVVLWFAIWLLWQVKNWFIEWFISLVVGVLIMLLLIALDYQSWLGTIDNDFVRIGLGSIIIGGGGVGVGTIVKNTFRPLYRGLKKTYLFESKR